MPFSPHHSPRCRQGAFLAGMNVLERFLMNSTPPGWPGKRFQFGMFWRERRDGRSVRAVREGGNWCDCPAADAYPTVLPWRQEGERPNGEIPEDSVSNHKREGKPRDPSFALPVREDPQQAQDGQRRDQQGIHAKGRGEVAVQEPVDGAERSAAGTIVARCRVERTWRKHAPLRGIDAVQEGRTDQDGDGDGQQPELAVWRASLVRRRHCGRSAGLDGSRKMCGRATRFQKCLDPAVPNTSKSHTTGTTNPQQKETQHHVLALFEAASAAALLPAVRWLLAIAANTMAGTPNGMQQKIVTKMAWTG